MTESTHIRIARPTDRLEPVVDFYKHVIGFSEIGRFEDHDGFNGVMLGHPKANYHLEFTQHQGCEVGRAPSLDHLLVFYIPDYSMWAETIRQIEANGGTPVDSFNPYWDRNGKTYEDPDGYRVVVQNAGWSNELT